MSASTLGLTFGLAHLISGMGAVATGRRLDVFGPRAVLGIIGPLGALIYGASSFATGPTFLVMYSLGGGLMGSASSLISLATSTDEVLMSIKVLPGFIC